MLRRLTAADLDAVVALDRVALGGWWSAHQYAAELGKSNTLFVGLPQASQLLSMGAAWFILDEAHIVLLAVHPQHRGQGWGRLTLTYLLQELPPTIRHATLEVGRRPHYYQQPDDDALILWRRDLPNRAS
jgi:ribosomal-protein-alanine N-acetyltransferase